MKKKILFFVAVIAIIVAGMVTATSVRADINPECPNGCVEGSGGCYCFDNYPQYAEHVWKEDLMAQ